MDRRTVPPDAITKNATFVGDDFKLAGLVEDILQLAPDTTNIEVILGATPLERYWTIEFRRAFEPFANRLSFNFLNDLSFDQMLERLSKLPPRSFILLGLFVRDASGVTHNEDEALQRLHAVANAPINGLYQNQLGLGIVGGHPLPGRASGRGVSPHRYSSPARRTDVEFPTDVRWRAKTAIRLAGIAALEHQREPPATRQRDRIPAADGVGAIPLVCRRCAIYFRPASGDDRRLARAADTPAPSGNGASAKS